MLNRALTHTLPDVDTQSLSCPSRKDFVESSSLENHAKVTRVFSALLFESLILLRTQFVLYYCCCTTAVIPMLLYHYCCTTIAVQRVVLGLSMSLCVMLLRSDERST